MSTKNPIIAIAFSAILAYGMTLSVTHVHIDHFHDIQTFHQITEVDSQCVLCGSVFKYSPNTSFEITDRSIPKISQHVFVADFALDPFHCYKSGRAPPSISAS